MKLTLHKREITGKKVAIMRRTGIIPWIVYGPHLEKWISVSFDKVAYIKAHDYLGSSSPLIIDLDGEEHMALMYDYAIDPVTNQLLHADFLAIQEGTKVSTSVSLSFVGISPAEKNKTWAVQHLREELEIQALPKDLPRFLEIDISSLEYESDVLYVKDLVLPDGIEILDDHDVAIATVSSLAVAVEDEPVKEIDDTEEGATDDKNGE